MQQEVYKLKKCTPFWYSHMTMRMTRNVSENLLLLVFTKGWSHAKWNCLQPPTTIKPTNTKTKTKSLFNCEQMRLPHFFFNEKRIMDIDDVTNQPTWNIEPNKSLLWLRWLRFIGTKTKRETHTHSSCTPITDETLLQNSSFNVDCSALVVIILRLEK